MFLFVKECFQFGASFPLITFTCSPLWSCLSFGGVNNRDDNIFDFLVPCNIYKNCCDRFKKLMLLSKDSAWSGSRPAKGRSWAEEIIFRIYRLFHAPLERCQVLNKNDVSSWKVLKFGRKVEWCQQKQNLLGAIGCINALICCSCWQNKMVNCFGQAMLTPDFLNHTH